MIQLRLSEVTYSRSRSKEVGEPGLEAGSRDAGNTAETPECHLAASSPGTFPEGLPPDGECACWGWGGVTDDNILRPIQMQHQPA